MRRRLQSDPLDPHSEEMDGLLAGVAEKLKREPNLQDNLASFDLALSADKLKTLDEASRIELGFPGALYAKELVRAFNHGGLRGRILA